MLPDHADEGGPHVSIAPTSSLYRITYRMERRDYVAMTAALAQPASARLAFEIAGYLAIVALAGLAFAGSTTAYARALADAFSLPLALLTVPLVLAGPLLLALRPRIAGLVAALLYKRHAMADRDVTLDLNIEGIGGGASDLYSHIGWGAVTRLIETPSHLFIQISRREAMALPRRAVANDDQWRNIVGFIRARTGLASK